MATLQNFDAEIAKTRQVVQDMRTKIEQSGTVLDTLATADKKIGDANFDIENARIEDVLKQQKDRLKRAAKKTPLLISGVTGDGVKEALRALLEVIGEAPVSDKAKSAAQAEPWAPQTG